MSEKELVVVVIAVAIILIVFMVRHRLRSLSLKSKLFEGKVEAYPRELPSSSPSPSGGVTITDNTLKGKKNRLAVRRAETQIRGNQLKGENNEIVVDSDQNSNNLDSSSSQD